MCVYIAVYILRGARGSAVARGIFGAGSSFGCGVAQGGKSFISVFQEFSSIIGKAFILAGGLGAGLSFYGV